MQYRHKQENSNPFQGRLNLLFTMIFLALATLILRLSFLQIAKGDESLAKAEAHMTVEQTIPAPRGLIFDRHHQLLVNNEPSFTVEYNVLGDESQNEHAIALRLVPYLKKPGESDSKAAARLEAVMKDQTIPISTPRILADHVDQKIVAFVMEHQDELPGVNIQVIPQREYVQNTLASHVLGHLGHIKPDAWPLYKPKGYQETDKIGAYGIEQQYEAQLRGKDGTQTVEVNRNYQPITSYQTTAPERGHDLVLNIDANLQKAVDDALAYQVNFLKDKNPQVKNAAAVAIDPNTGDVLAMGSYPEFNPNDWASGSISPENYEKFQPAWYNYALEYPYPPGSTVKPITVMMGLQKKVITPQEKIFDPGYLKLNDTERLYNWNKGGDGPVDAVRALARSNNTYMGTVMFRLGGWPTTKNVNDWLINDLPKTAQMVRDYHKQMGLGVSTGIDLPNEDTGQWNFDKQLYSLPAIGIGQNMAYTVTQLAQYCGILANGGNRMELHVVHQILQGEKDPKTDQETEKVIQIIQPKVLNKMPFTQDELKVVWDGMWAVTHSWEGTAGTVFQGAPYDVRAKTGTSENASDITENSVFIGFMPADKPTIAIAIIIPNVSTDSHSYELVGPIARKIMDQWWNETKSQVQGNQNK